LPVGASADGGVSGDGVYVSSSEGNVDGGNGGALFDHFFSELIGVRSDSFQRNESVRLIVCGGWRSGGDERHRRDEVSVAILERPKD